MLYGYDKIPLSENIRGYEKVGQYLEVEMLDGKVFLFDYDVEKEKHILMIMENQALERKNTFKINNLYQLRNRLKIYNTIALIGYVALLNITDINLVKIFATVLAVGWTGVTCFANLAVNDHIEELNKYDIFFDIKDQLEKYSADMYMGNISNKKYRDRKININNIDKYTLKEIEKVKINIKKII